MAAKLGTYAHPAIPDRSELTVPDSEIEAVIARIMAGICCRGLQIKYFIPTKHSTLWRK